MSGLHQSLQGIRIIELSMGWAGPLACRHAADLGADVIKVESCERFDWWRSWEATEAWIADDGAEKSTQFNTVNRNKRNVTLDLEHPEGRRLFLELVATAHAVVENYSGGVLPKLNLGYEVLNAARKDIILLSMPAFGATGPWRKFRAYGSTVEQSSGLPHLHGTDGDPPTMLHVAYGDAVGGLTGATALMIALRHQARTGQGQLIDLSQVQSLFPLGAHGILHFAANGTTPERRGNRAPDQAPRGVYPCAGEDNWVVIEVSTEQQWQALRDLVGGALDGFDGLADRDQRAAELDHALNAWTRQHQAPDLVETLQQSGIPAAATHRASTLLHDPHLTATGFWQWHERAVVGRQPHPSAPYREGQDPLPIQRPAPTLGEHNREVLVDLLGLSQDQYQSLIDQGVVGTRPRMRRAPL